MLGCVKEVQIQGADAIRRETPQRQVLTLFNILQNESRNGKIQKHSSNTCDCELALTPAYVINKTFNISEEHWVS